MQTEFRKSVLPDEIRDLRAFDRKVFSKADLFTTQEWEEYESFWMIVDGTAVGCCAFQLNVDFKEDVREDQINPPMKGSLYIATTGILPAFQGKGMGPLLKSWQIAYAKYCGFGRIVTNTRNSNIPMILLNYRVGFRVIRITPRYYTRPVEATVVMELKL
jgi:ribosomal protein S18 acetylase RimI-like enzyme